MVYEAESLESARAIVEADAVYSGGVVSRGSTFEYKGESVTIRATGSGTRSGCSCTRCSTLCASHVHFISDTMVGDAYVEVYCMHNLLRNPCSTLAPFCSLAPCTCTC